MPYPRPANEEQRLRAIAELGILDTPREPQFDAIVEMAREMLGAPIGLISVLSEHRQWFKAASGLETSETHRDVAFCNHTICGSGPFVVDDALSDPRFARNLLVSGEPFIRSYAGVPLFLQDGIAVGSLCVLHSEPRRFSEQDLLRLRQLGDITASLLRQFQNVKRLELLGFAHTAPHDAVAAVARRAGDFEAQERILDEVSPLSKVGAWTRDLRTNGYEWSDAMYALHEVGSDFQLSDESIASFYRPEEFHRLKDLVEDAKRTDCPYTFEGEMVTAKGNLRYIRLTAQVQFEDGVATRRYGTKQDITLEKRRTEEMTRLAERDSLSGLYNRSYFQKYLRGFTGKLGAGTVSVDLLLLDLDGFKNINDSHGHAAGDHCLIVVAERLSAASCESLLVARIGGDEFAVLVEGDISPVLQGKIGKLGKQIIDAIAEPIQWMGHALELTTSIGVARQGAGKALDPDGLLLEADLALYAAKDAGRNRIMYFDNALKVAAYHRFLSLANMRAALRDGQLELYYQPKVRLSDGRPCGFEALIRWNSPDRGVVPPGAFAEALVDPKLGVEIGNFVIRAALDQAERWAAAGLPFGSIAINLSSAQFRDTSTAEMILRELEIRGLPSGILEVEVTEDVFLSRSAETVLEVCRLLKEKDVRIAFDDFGTGFASLTHLMEFPVDIIKIDRSFVSALEQKPETGAIVRAIVGMCRALGLTVVAEGVETKTQAEFLRAIECELAQGYLYAQPLPAEHVANWLAGPQRQVA